MAAFWCKGMEIYEILSEMAGRKAGLALSMSEIVEHLDAESLPPQDDSPIRMRYEDLEALARGLLYRVGALEYNSRHSMPTLDLYAAHPGEAERSIIATITEEFIACGERSQGNGPVDITPLFENVRKRHSDDLALPLLREFYARLQDHLNGSFMSSFRRVEWTNVEELSGLFLSEGIQPKHGAFLDQRYVDYLSRNFDAIDAMNWRKFEALTGEFFQRGGFRVELGQGRNDGGIDARIWLPGAGPNEAPLILVQCKRQKQKVGKVIVKSLWADVEHEGASSGLIVTTSALESGAAEVAIARSYPVTAVERPMLRRWLEALRTPGSGVLTTAG